MLKNFFRKFSIMTLIKKKLVGISTGRVIDIKNRKINIKNITKRSGSHNK